jgi:hypothetical protein
MSLQTQRTGGGSVTDRGTTNKSKRSRARHHSGHVRTKDRYNGIHRRRDKRIPFSSPLPVPDGDPAAPATVSDKQQDEAGASSWILKWSEALMLWLSWNSTFEKVTAKMYAENCNPTKMEALMDEMDELRRRAVDLSEQLISQE